MNKEKIISEDRYFWINDNDKDLKPIRVDIEKIKRWTYEFHHTPFERPTPEQVDGYGLSPDEQIFKRAETPPRLLQLEKKFTNHYSHKRKKGEIDTGDAYSLQEIIVKIRHHLIKEKRDYKEELLWIKKQWYYCLFGYYFYNDSQITYIPPWYYSYLNWWSLGSDGHPTYKEKDREVFLFETFCYLDRETFIKLDKDGWAIPEEDETYLMKDTGRRVCYGWTHAAGRRSGKTNRMVHVIDQILMLTMGAEMKGGFISITDDHAAEQYRTYFLPNFKLKPFWFKPLWSGTGMPTTQLNYMLPNKITNELELQSTFLPATKADRLFYDGMKLIVVAEEEPGKTKTTNVYEGWNILKYTLKQGDKIHGLGMADTTVRDMEAGGGENFHQYCNNSNYYSRDPLTGETKTGKYNYFIPAWHGKDGYIDKHGRTIKTNPTPEQVKFTGKEYGALDAIMSARAELLKQNTVKAKADYIRLCKEEPIWYYECWLGDAGESGLDIQAISEQLQEVEKELPPKGYYYEWEGEKFKSNVRQIQDDKKGYWYLTELAQSGEHNVRRYTNKYNHILEINQVTYEPINPKKVIGADPHDTGKERSHIYHSDGAAVLYVPRDMMIDDKREDGTEKEEDEWITERPIGCLRHRFKTNEEYNEQILMACIYNCAMLYPEANKSELYRYFINNGFYGYLLFELANVAQGVRKFNTYPGIYLNKPEQKKEGLSLIEHNVAHHIHKIKLPLLLTELKEFTGIEDLHKFDLVAAYMHSLKGARHPLFQYIAMHNNNKSTGLDYTKMRG